MKYSEPFTVCIAVQTKDGSRYLYYTPADASNLGAETYAHHGLGTSFKNGNWHTLERNIDADLKEAQPDNKWKLSLVF